MAARSPPGVPEPEVGATETRSIDVPGFEPALLFTPAGSERRPLVVAAHGAGGGPEWECSYWRRLTHEHAFVLCLRGTPLGSYPGYFFRDHRALEREFEAATQAARSSEPRIASGSGLYAGFSQGATMGTSMIAEHGAEFPFLVLIESFESWNVPRARAFARSGGKKVLLACGSRECEKVGSASARWLSLGGLETHFDYARGAGHTPAGEVMIRVDAELPWLLAGDPGWTSVF